MVDKVIKSFALSSILLLVPFLLLSQNHFDATLKMKDGTVKKGFVEGKKTPNLINIRVFDQGTKEVNFSTNQEGPFKPIASSKIDELELRRGPEHIVTLKYLFFKIEMGKGPLKKKEYKNPHWMQLINQCKNIEVYEAFSQYGMRGDNLLRNPDISYYGATHEPGLFMKRPGEKRASMVGRYLDTTEPSKFGPKTFHKMNRKLFSYYFQNDKKVLGLIGDKNISPESIQKILDDICVEIE